MSEDELRQSEAALHFRYPPVETSGLPKWPHRLTEKVNVWGRYRELFLDGKTDDVQSVFDLMEYWLEDDSRSLRELIVIEFFEDVQNLALGQGLALGSFVPFLGPKSLEAWGFGLAKAILAEAVSSRCNSHS